MSKLQEIIIKNQEQILEQIKLLLTNKTRLTFYQKGCKPQIVFAKGIDKKAAKIPLLVFFKQKNFKALQENCNIFYRLKGGLMRGFQSVPHKEAKRFLALELPKNIFQIQMRKHPRVKTPGDSRVMFSQIGKQRLHLANLIDIGLRGAKLRGRITANVKKGDLIGPLSFTLCMNNLKIDETTLNVYEASVVRIKEIGGDKQETEMAITYKLNEKEQMPLEDYIQMRDLEDTTSKKYRAVSDKGNQL